MPVVQAFGLIVGAYILGKLVGAIAAWAHRFDFRPRDLVGQVHLEPAFVAWTRCLSRHAASRSAIASNGCVAASRRCASSDDTIGHRTEPNGSCQASLRRRM